METNDDLQSQDEIQRPNFRNRAEELYKTVDKSDIDDPELGHKRLLVRAYRFAVLMLAGISRTELARRAAALTYTTILSLFPILAVVSSMASIFYTEEKEAEFMATIERTLLPSLDEGTLPEKMSKSEAELVAKQREFTQGFRDMFRGVSAKFRENAGGVGVFGLIGMLVTAGLLYYSVESVVNFTWQTSHGKWTQTFTNFITVLVFAPIIIGLSLTASTLAVTLLDKDSTAPPPAKDVSISSAESSAPSTAETTPAAKATDMTAADDSAANSELESTTVEVVEQPKKPSKLLLFVRSITTRFGFLLPYIPFCLNAFILTVAYSFLPKANVKFKAALTGALVAAALWEIARYAFFYYVYMSSVNRTLADALGLSVIFLIWVYITWLILLLGNMVVYVTQNFRTLWAIKRSGGEMMLDSRLVVAVMVLLARRFQQHKIGMTEEEIRTRLGLRNDEYSLIIGRLLREKYVARLEDESYIIAFPVEHIKVRDLLHLGCNLTTLPASQRLNPVGESLRWLQEQTLAMAGEKNLSDFVGDKKPNTE